MKKKFIKTLAIVVAIASLTACNKQETTVVEESTQKETTVEENEIKTNEGAVEETSSEAVEAISGNIEAETVIQEETPQNNVVNAEEVIAKYPDAFSDKISDNVLDFQVSINGLVYKLPMWYEAFATQGWKEDCDVTETLPSKSYVDSFCKRGDDKAYFKFVNIAANPCTIEKSLVAGFSIDSLGYEMSSDNYEIILAKGITLGKSTLDEVLDAYGEPLNRRDGTISITLVYAADKYSISTVELSFDAKTNVFNSTRLTNIVEVEGLDNSVSEEVPNGITEYKAPEAVSDNMWDYTAEIEGKLYQFPCPLQVLLDNGFTIGKEKPESVASGRSEYIELLYNKEKQRLLLYNFSDYATTPENCWIGDMESNDSGPKINMTIANGITRGTSVEEMVKYLEDNNIKYKALGEPNTVYYIYGENKGAQGYEIAVKNGVVFKIVIKNAVK